MLSGFTNGAHEHSQVVMTLTGQQLDWLLEGYDIVHLKPHKTLQYSSIL